MASGKEIRPSSDALPSRRDFLARAGAGLIGAAGLAATSGTSRAATPGKRVIQVAGYDYDRCRAIIDGTAGIEGSEVSFHFEDIYSVNDLAFGKDPRYEVSELGLIPFITKYVNGGFRGYSLIPVFISRIFRHRNIFVRADAGMVTPGDLKGRRVGTPGYGMSANTWIRGFLLDEYGIAADDFEWIETTKSSDAGKLGGSGWSAFGEESGYFFPDDFPIRQGPVGVDESELLLSGECDALITAITPRAFLEGDPMIRRLFPDVRAAETAYYLKTRMFPIMHVVGIRNDAIEADPGLPVAVFRMYSEAKRAAYAKLETTTSLRVTLPWLTQELEETRAIMGDDYWPYGIEANRKELEHVMRYCYEQHLVKEPVGFEELFHPSTLAITEGPL